MSLSSLIILTGLTDYLLVEVYNLLYIIGVGEGGILELL